MAESNTRRIVLLGKTGSGKSSLANTLFGENTTFKVNHSANSETKHCVSETKCINGKNVQLVDTPGFFDTDPKSTELSEELLKCIVECAPGPHAFLLVLKIEKFTLLEQMAVALMDKYFSKEALKYTTVVFTHGDDLPPEETIKEWVNNNEDLKKLVQKCEGRCHVFDNKYWNNSQDPYRNNQYQIQQLLETIDQTVENNGGPYTSEILQQVNDNIQEEVKKIEKSYPGKYTPKEKEEKAKEKVLGRLKKHKVMIKAVLLGLFIGGLAGVGLTLGVTSAPMVEFGRALEAAAGTEVGAAVEAAMRGAEGGAVMAAVEKAVEKGVAGLAGAVGAVGAAMRGAGGGAVMAAAEKAVEKGVAGLAGVVGAAVEKGVEKGGAELTGAVAGAAVGAAVAGAAVGGGEEQWLIEPSSEEQIERYVDDVQRLYEQLEKIKKQYLV